MAFQRIVTRTLPDGSTAKVYPFHLSLEGLESNLLCRDEEDYDVVEKCMYVSAWQCNVLGVSHVVMSNHGHQCVLAPSMEHVLRLAENLKQRCSMYIARKYGEHNVLLGTSTDVQLLDSDWYVRNVLAYIPRNVMALDIRPEDYPWCSYRALFVDGISADGHRMVSALSRREKEALLHTHTDLSRVPWLLDRDGHLVPTTCCDWAYAESAFGDDQTFFLKTIGTVNTAEMEQKLVHNHRAMSKDSAFLLIVNDMAERWFQKKPFELTIEQKTRIIPYLFHCYRTTVPQLARCLRMERDEVERITGKRLARRRFPLHTEQAQTETPQAQTETEQAPQTDGAGPPIKRY